MRCSLCHQGNEAAASLEAECPHCGSLPEDRAFARFFRDYAHPEAGAKILDVAPPSPQLANFTRFVGEAKYTAVAPVRLPGSEALKPPHRFLEMDITRMSFSDSSFDIIICNHVLPYVRSDFLAMSEMHRCLKAQGVAFLNVSVHPGKSKRSGEGNGLPGTGQEWSYGEDYFERLEAAGLFVQKVALAPLLKDLPEGLGVPEGAQQVVCFKFRDTMDAFLGRIPR